MSHFQLQALECACDMAKIQNGLFLSQRQMRQMMVIYQKGSCCCAGDPRYFLDLQVGIFDINF